MLISSIAHRPLPRRAAGGGDGGKEGGGGGGRRASRADPSPAGGAGGLDALSRPPRSPRSLPLISHTGRRAAAAVRPVVRTQLGAAAPASPSVAPFGGGSVAILSAGAREAAAAASGRRAPRPRRRGRPAHSGRPLDGRPALTRAARARLGRLAGARGAAAALGADATAPRLRRRRTAARLPRWPPRCHDRAALRAHLRAAAAATAAAADTPARRRSLSGRTRLPPARRSWPHPPLPSHRPRQARGARCTAAAHHRRPRGSPPAPAPRHTPRRRPRRPAPTPPPSAAAHERRALLASLLPRNALGERRPQPRPLPPPHHHHHRRRSRSAESATTHLFASRAPCGRRGHRLRVCDRACRRRRRHAAARCPRRWVARRGLESETVGVVIGRRATHEVRMCRRPAAACRETQVSLHSDRVCSY